tara:strand:+ start:214 stop:444 length:231 start_codon:yes stop_codon:yes gene_type:complete
MEWSRWLIWRSSGRTVMARTASSLPGGESKVLSWMGSQLTMVLLDGKRPIVSVGAVLAISRPRGSCARATAWACHV